MDWREFEILARKTMSKHFGVILSEGTPPSFPKRFDMISLDGQIVGDAKYLTLVRGEKTPPAKFMEISGHIWLLEKVNAKHKFLVFGNQREVPEWWLKKYGSLVNDVKLFFLSENGDIQQLR